MPLDPVQALTTLETSLRVITREILGDRWQTSFTPAEVGKLERARARDLDRRHGISTSGDLLDYTETKQLTTIIRENWESFDPVFRNQERTYGFLQVLDDVRFSVAHSRDLVPFERDLLNGINGQLRQQIALWRNRDDPSTRFYPRIESVKDNYGNQGFDDRLGITTRPLLGRLSVGETLRFTGAAFGQQKFPVLWAVRASYFDSIAVGSQPIDNQAEGNQVELEYTVTEEDVSEEFVVTVFIFTASKYNRHGTFDKHDDARRFPYAVDPPDEM